MVETRSNAQTVGELATHLEEVRLQAEERSSEMRRELAELKALLLQSLAHKQSPSASSAPDDPSSSSAVQEQTNRTPIVDDLNPKPPDPVRSTAVKLFSDSPRNPMVSGGLATRLAKIEFPRFDGTLFREWIYKCEQFFLLDGTIPELKVRLAALHMEGKALQWHHNFMSSRFDQFPSWPEYIVSVSARFGRLYDDPLADIVSLKQGTDSVETFLDKFECALTRMQLPVQHALSIFLTNMSPHLALHVRQFNPATMAEAARIARLHESSIQLTPAKPMSSIEDRDDVKYVKEVYFDPGGTDFDAHQMFDEMPTLFISKEVRFPKEIAKINAIVVENEQVIAKETSVFSAHQVLGKMSKSYVKEELILLDEIAKTNENLVHGTDWEATPVGLFERLDDVKVVEEVCFDPGGTSLLQHSHLSVAGLLEETVKDDELMNQEGHSSQSAAKIKSNSAKEPSCLDALNVLDEMPRFIFSLEVKFSADIAKINDKFVNGHDLKAPPSGSVERLANVTAPEEGTPRDAIPTNPALKVGFSAQARMISENVYLISFDPGGSTMTERGNAFSLSYVNCENGVSKVEKSAQIEKKNEHEAIKELVHFAAHQMLDEMPKSMKCCELELFDEFKTVLEDTVQLENRNPTVQGTPISRNEDQDNSSIFKASIFMQLVIIAQVQCLLVHILGRIQLSIYAANFKGHGCATWRCLIS